MIVLKRDSRQGLSSAISYGCIFMICLGIFLYPCGLGKDLYGAIDATELVEDFLDSPTCGKIKFKCDKILSSAIGDMPSLWSLLASLSFIASDVAPGPTLMTRIVHPGTGPPDCSVIEECRSAFQRFTAQEAICGWSGSEHKQYHFSLGSALV